MNHHATGRAKGAHIPHRGAYPRRPQTARWLITITLLASLGACDRGGADPSALSTLAAPPPPQGPGLLLQAHTGAPEGTACAQDRACAQPLRCLEATCRVPPAIDGRTPDAPLRVRFEPSGVEVLTEVADEPFEQQQGLMWRTRMAPDWGMLFVFPNTQPRSFWMKNTYIPLDILYIRDDGTILNIAERTTPLQTSPPYPSAGPARYVLEVNGGFCAQHNIQPGQRLSLHWR